MFKWGDLGNSAVTESCFSEFFWRSAFIRIELEPKDPRKSISRTIDLHIFMTTRSKTRQIFTGKKRLAATFRAKRLVLMGVSIQRKTSYRWWWHCCIEPSLGSIWIIHRALVAAENHFPLNCLLPLTLSFALIGVSRGRQQLASQPEKQSLSFQVSANQQHGIIGWRPKEFWADALFFSNLARFNPRCFYINLRLNLKSNRIGPKRGLVER